MVGRILLRARRALSYLRHPRAFLRSRPRALERRVRTYFGEAPDLERREQTLAARVRELAPAAHPHGAAPDPRLPIAPVVGKVTSGFGDRFGRMHHGSDFAVPEGTPIRAAAEGTVALIEHMPEYGTTTVVSHGLGLTTLYAHQQQVHVQVGDHVRAGDPIGLVGTTGRVTGPHLHFEVRLDGVPRDPVALLPTAGLVIPTPADAG